MNCHDNILYILTKLSIRVKRSYHLKLNINENNVIIERREPDVTSHYTISKKILYYNNVIKQINFAKKTNFKQKLNNENDDEN